MLGLALVLLRRYPEYAMAIAMQEGEAQRWVNAEGGELSGGPWALARMVDEMVAALPIERVDDPGFRWHATNNALVEKQGYTLVEPLSLEDHRQE